MSSEPKAYLTPDARAQFLAAKKARCDRTGDIVDITHVAEYIHNGQKILINVPNENPGFVFPIRPFYIEDQHIPFLQFDPIDFIDIEIGDHLADPIKTMDAVARRTRKIFNVSVL